MNTKLILPILAFVFLSCQQNISDFKQELSEEHLVQLELKTLKISLMIPKENNVFDHDSVILIDLNPNERNIKQFSISQLKSTIPMDKYKESLIFENGVVLNYYTSETVEGSGGSEYELEGIFKFENGQYKITSIDQKELGKGNPEFCLKYLSTIEVHEN